MNKKTSGKQKTKTKTERAMRSWTDERQRKAGKRDFIAELKKPGKEQERAACCADPGTAKEKFAEYGRFYIKGKAAKPGQPPVDPDSEIVPIPAETVFRVFERANTEKRDELVTIILPTTGTKNENLDQDYRCTWIPYATKKSKRTPAKESSKRRKR